MRNTHSSLNLISACCFLKSPKFNFYFQLQSSNMQQKKGRRYFPLEFYILRVFFQLNHGVALFNAKFDKCGETRFFLCLSLYSIKVSLNSFFQPLIGPFQITTTTPRSVMTRMIKSIMPILVSEQKIVASANCREKIFASFVTFCARIIVCFVRTIHFFHSYLQNSLNHFEYV